ncbi:zinc ribbon domain-containing protein [Gottfriedia acidiceleris]|uniref:zinc ribbon domain-containing protein n=1 Tax=Gottfriedia acidiceleris TaxID=371036 RepID=UPI000B44CFD7|nr:zinc ribbon domain-containing protein [Gottfriedia acidiceleris]
MFCKICGNSLVENDRFCGNCGTKVITLKNEEVISTIHDQINEDLFSGESVSKVVTSRTELSKLESARNVHNGLLSQTETEPGANSQAINHINSEQFNQFKSSMLDFWSFFKLACKKPYGVAQAVNEKHFLKGIIILILYSLLIPATLYNVLKIGIKSTESVLGGYTNFSSQLNFSALVISPFVMILIVHLVTVITSYIFLKGKKTNLQLKEVIARLGTLYSVSLALIFFAFILSYVSITLCLIFVLISIFISISVVPLLISSFQNTNSKGIDSLYIISIVFIVMSITQIILLRSVIINTIDRMSDLLLGKLF